MPHRRGRTFLEAVVVVIVLAALGWAGLAVRERTWAITEPIRYAADMKNGWAWGSRAASEGYFSLYDRVARDAPENYLGLDYLPLRLAVMTAWAHGVLANDPTIKEWPEAYEANRPLLRFNLFCEAMTAIGVGLLAFDWLRRDRRPSLLGESRPLYGVWIAVIACAFAWLNPASIVSAHGRPTWDVWVTPFYVWAVLAGTKNLWFTAGCVVGVGAMFKGQQLFGLPFLVLWPLMRGRFGAAGRLVVGFALAVTLIASPWVVGPFDGPIVFVVGVSVLPVISWLVLRYRPIRGRSLPASGLRWLIPAAMAGAIIACVPLFGGSTNWLNVGLIYGANKFKALEVGGASSLAGLLQHHWKWQPTDPLPTSIQLFPGMTISHLMMGMFGLAVLASAWAAARFEKYADRRFLLAIAAPWIVYFAVFPKMHERYLLWGATIACTAVAVNFGLLGLAVFFTLASTCMSLLQMATGSFFRFGFSDRTPQMGRDLHRWLNPTYPGLGYAVLLAAAVWVWVMLAGAVTTRKRRDRIRSQDEAAGLAQRSPDEQTPAEAGG